MVSLKTTEWPGMCSWCFKDSTHTLETKKMIKSDVFHCNGCMRKTVRCDNCHNNFAREFEDFTSDKKCLQCAGLISEWNGDDTILDVKMPCSWCFNDCGHKPCYLKKKIHECRDCGATTKPCSKCGDAMARYGVSSKCLKCEKLVKSWDNVDANRKSLEKEGYCSICIENTTFSLVNKNAIRRDLYCCNSCGSKVMPCRECKNNFTKTGPTHLKCLQCNMEKSSKKITWEDFIARKEKLYNQCNEIEFLKSEMSRPSEEKDNAMKEGMIRPFLLLVSMHPGGRVAVANSLNIDLITWEHWGDSHKEAWYIMTKTKAGMRGNATGVVSTVTRKGCDWYSLLSGVNDSTLKLSGFDANDKFMASLEADNRYEALFLEGIAKQLTDKMNPKYAPIIDRILATPEMQAMLNRIPLHSLKSSDSIKRAVVELSFSSELKKRGWKEDAMPTQDDTFCDYDSEESGDDFAAIVDTVDLESEDAKAKITEFSATLVANLSKRLVTGEGYFKKKEMTKKVGKQVAFMGVQRFVIMPLFLPLGVALIVTKVGSGILGSDHGKNFGPVYFLLLHQVALQVQGIDIGAHY
eukprot:Nk52_evm5s2640 gene=Nk52_evmTU5s2640